MRNRRGSTGNYPNNNRHRGGGDRQERSGGHRGNGGTQGKRYSGRRPLHDGDGDNISPRQRQAAMSNREKYVNMGLEARASGDRVQAEYYFQHAEHYTRIINLAQSQHDARQGSDQEQEDDDGGEEGTTSGDQNTAQISSGGNSRQWQQDSSTHGMEEEATDRDAFRPERPQSHERGEGHNEMAPRRRGRVPKTSRESLQQNDATQELGNTLHDVLPLPKASGDDD